MFIHEDLRNNNDREYLFQNRENTRRNSTHCKEFICLDTSCFSSLMIVK